ncbi:MAG: rubredoxin-like domain-containing protein [Dehalococcoidales bacterium]
MIAKKIWRCTVCNDIHCGIAPPEICPTCQVRHAYVAIDKTEARFVMEL